MSSTSKQGESSSKMDTAKSEDESNDNSRKITSFFPVVRPEGRAKMCASKAGDSKQKEILQKLKNKQSEESDASNPKERTRASISVMSALKTPLSQVLRRSLDADSKKEISPNPESYPDKDASAKLPVKISQKAKKSFSSSDSSGIALTRSTRFSKSGPAKPPTPSLRSVSTKRSADDTPGATRKRVTVSEPAEKSATKTCAINKANSQDEDPESKTKIQKKKKRRFRGGTYSLFLSKKSKKKKQQPNSEETKGAEETKEDEGSVDDSSYLDSEDGNSLMSEDLYATSEKSALDEEQNPDSNSMLGKSSVSLESSVKDKTDFAETLKTEESETVEKELDTSNEEKPDEMDWETEAKPEIDQFKDESTPNEEDKEIPEESTEEKVELEDAEESEVKDETASLAEENDKDDFKDVEKAESNEDDSENLTPEKEFAEADCDDGDNLPNSTIQSSGDEQEDSLSDAHPSTIATSVKSRTRVKRRFTDDIVDTDVGLLSLHSSSAPSKKVPPPPKLDPPKDVIQMFKAVTQSEAKKSQVGKVECIYNSHQEPIKNCNCNDDTLEANIGEDEDGVFCQAVDSIDDKLVGCFNPVVTPWLVRPSVKIPFTIMCEMHLWRLKHHHSCPYCGLFCSQGSFMQCSSFENNKKVVHLYHEGCQPNKEEGLAPFCLHCGAEEGLKKVTLEMQMASPPAFFMSQIPSLGPQPLEKARMSFATPEEVQRRKLKEEAAVISYKIKGSQRVLTSIGLKGEEKEELDRLLQLLNDDKIEPCEVVPEDFYNACLEGEVTKVLNMLAQGIDPNLKYKEHDNNNALHAAAMGGNITVIHLLIQAGCTNDVLNEKIFTPLMLAVDKNNKDAVIYLINKGAVADYKGENGMSSFHMAAKNGSLDILKTLMGSRDVDINSQDDGGWTPIVWASEHNHFEVVKYLLQRGANPNIRDSEDNIGLHWSAFSGSLDICFMYLDYGCDINAVNERGDTPLHIAARQDALSCVNLLLSRGADVQIKNKADQLPGDCCLNKNSETYLALSLNMLLKKISKKYKHKSEKILSKDISRGKEQISIQCVNEVDDEGPPVDFLYVTENCETTPMNIDRTITSLQYCQCEDDCSTGDCTCARISYQCWYDKDGLLLPTFNLSDPPLLFECNRACSCWSVNCRNRVLQNGITCRLQLIRTKGKGWGVRTLKDIPKGTFICEYVGEMISDSAADKRADDSYLFDLDNRDGETYCLDARYYGNISRFINHLCEPNLVPVKVYVDHQDLNFPRIAFFSSRDIKQYEELGFDYCEKFWVIKYKYFTCDCGSPRCKYSKDTIHTTLANYYKRVREEQMEENPAALQPPAPEGTAVVVPAVNGPVDEESAVADVGFAVNGLDVAEPLEDVVHFALDGPVVDGFAEPADVGFEPAVDVSEMEQPLGDEPMVYETFEDGDLSIEMSVDDLADPPLEVIAEDPPLEVMDEQLVHLSVEVEEPPLEVIAVEDQPLEVMADEEEPPVVPL